MWLDEALAWNRAASHWVQFIRFAPEGGWARQALLHPLLFKLTGPLRGKAVLDAGTGEGYLARMMAAQGARVIGLDISAAMIEAARELEADRDPPIEYVQGSVTDLRAFGDERFDVVVSVFVLSMLANIEQAYRELARVLRRDGVLVVAVLHPAFDGVGAGWIHQDGERRWVLHRYSESVEGTHAFGATVYHRPVSAYVHAAARAGLLVSDMCEPTADVQLSRSLPAQARLYDRIPDILLISHVKR